MNSWNGLTAPAYNLKIYNVIPNKYQDKVYELMQYDGFYDTINDLINDFSLEHNHEWQAGFNGRSGGYLVLYSGGIENNRRYTSYKSIDIKDVPSSVRKAFRQLALDIIAETIYMAENAEIKEVERKVVNKYIIY